MSSASRAQQANTPGKTPISLVNWDSVGGVALTSGVGVPSTVVKIVSGALVANTLATQINRVGSGVINFLRVIVNDATSRTLHVRLTLDGTVVFDSTSLANVTNQAGMQVIGGLAISGSWSVELDQIPYSSSFKLEVASSLSETGAITTLAQHRINS